MAKSKYFTIRKRGNGWQANLSRTVTGGKRIQITRLTKAEAEAEAERQLQTLADYGADFLNFTPEQLRACGEAIRKLTEKDFKATAITDAVDYFTEHNDPKATKRTVLEIRDEFLASKNSAGLSSFTVADYRQKLTRFSQEFGKRYIHSITPTEIEGWLDSVKARGTTRQDYRRHLGIFWRYAIARKYTRENAASAVTKIKVVRKPPTILSSQEVRSLLFAAKEHNLGRMLPYFAIGCFCGLRPWELRRTAWSDVNISNKEIYVTPEACKTAQDRFVTMPDCLIAWLNVFPDSTRKGAIYYARMDFNAIRRKAGLHDTWDRDIMRHSAASHLYGMTQNAALTTAQMGHGLSVFLKHYKRAVTKADGESYFKVLPTDQEINVMQFAKTAG